MRVVLDSNVLIAAFVARGSCAELLEHCVREHDVVASPFLLEEVRRNLVKKFGASPADASQAVELLRSRFEIIEPKELKAPACRDPDDDVILATAVGGSCELLVTGDRDLLDLKRYAQVRIVSPRDFWREEANR